MRKDIAEKDNELHNLRSISNVNTETVVGKWVKEVAHLQKLVFKMQRDVTFNLCALTPIVNDEKIEFDDMGINVKTATGNYYPILFRLYLIFSINLKYIFFIKAQNDICMTDSTMVMAIKWIHLCRS